MGGRTEVGVRLGLLGGDALLVVVPEQAVQEVDRLVGDVARVLPVATTIKVSRAASNRHGDETGGGGRTW